MTLDQLNALPEAQAYTAFERCCVAPNWINAMTKARPFASVNEVLDKADQIWKNATRADILAAFEGHPRIGDVATLKKKYANSANLAGHEQAGMNSADEKIIERMAEQNDAYFEKFGYIFIVCASGKSAAEMLALIDARLLNSEADELPIAAAEQGKITAIRLNQLLSES